MIKRLIKRLCRHRGMNFINFAAGSDALKGNAVLRSVKVGCGKRDISIDDLRQGRINPQELLRSEYPMAIRAGHLKKRPIRPKLRQPAQFFAQFAFPTQGGIGQNQTPDSFKIRAGSIVNRGFNAAPEPDIAHPEEGHERQSQNYKVEGREARANRQVHEAVWLPTEYPKPRCV